MVIEVKFMQVLERASLERGWLAGGIGGAFPDEHAVRISPDTLLLHCVSRFQADDDIALFRWDLAEIMVSRSMETIQSIRIVHA